ncbi:protein of unknown function [endosymbiont DhMRE of Dentiscutata heterogama]|uniref:hypothetical protein n=1 Tax=endosymbiont DhMRE of Dentiscutata heterogama TaxID=1609546 RepID=UPI000629DB83|nr:hypothetical protein [endosymbiont DhMRE of Dentiscutata heterogama]CFW92802.1 protein of unknown function [endosymbiont DhMRE of Dentiscutata heterogama]
MTHTHINKNNIPVYAEQKLIQTDLKSKDILKTKTPIPDNFLKLASNERNYMCSTQGWKEPICERFVFTYEEEWIQLDIPHTLMKELDLPLEENIPHSVYISPQILERQPICGGLTIENKKEIIIDKPFSKDQETQTDLTSQQILNQINQLQQEDNLNQQTIINLQGEIAELEERLTEVEKMKRVWKDKWLKEKGRNSNLTNERDDYQTKWDNSIEELELKEQISQSYLQLISELRNDLESKLLIISGLNEEKNTKQRELEQQNEQIEQLTTEKNDLTRKNEELEQEKVKLKEDLDRELGWWNKWFRSPLAQEVAITSVVQEYFQKPFASWTIKYGLTIRTQGERDQDLPGQQWIPQRQYFLTESFSPTGYTNPDVFEHATYLRLGRAAIYALYKYYKNQNQ